MEPIEPISAAGLDDPQYYRRNLETVISWVLHLYPDDVLAPAEKQHFNAILSLPEPARALLTRLIMRRGDFFRLDVLDYPEISTDLTPAIQALREADLVVPTGTPQPEDLNRLFRFPELLQVELGPGSASAGRRIRTKRELLDWLNQCSSAHYATIIRALHRRWPWVALTRSEYYERLRLLFFGNRRQSWSDFVLVELGQTRYQRVALEGVHRPFQNRSELITYERLSMVRDHLDDTGDLDSAVASTPANPVQPAWLESRRQRVLLALGSHAYRQKQWSLALRAWSISSLPEALVRRARLLEQLGFRDLALHECTVALERSLPDTATEALKRVLSRCQTPRQRSKRRIRGTIIPTATITLTTPNSGESVERLAASAASAGGNEAYYTENTLFTGLFGLVFWDALFAPLPGAFFHPFQAAPADLYEPEFVGRRQALIDRALEQFRSPDGASQVLRTWDEHFGITNRFVHWEILSRPLLATVLTLVPTDHLVAILMFMLKDMSRHRSGYPDLLVVNPRLSHYELIEVKGPGDRLQPQQTEFLRWCQEQGIPASVLHVNYPESIA